MFRNFGVVLLLGAVFAATAPVHGAILVDGQLDDWGITFKDANAGSAPQPGLLRGSAIYPGDVTLVNDPPGFFGRTAFGNRTEGDFSYFYMIEDLRDNAGPAEVVGDNTGGQDYDGEFLGVGVKGNKLYIAILTGQRPDSLLSRFSPGDIRIQTSGGTFGVEVGGGAGGQNPLLDGSFSGGAVGTTYNIDNVNGSTRGGTNSDGTTFGLPGSSGPADPAQVAGSVWKEPTWILDPFAPQDEVQAQFNGGGTLVGSASAYIFKWNAFNTANGDPNHVGNDHTVIEVEIPISAFLETSGVSLEKISWFPGCGNDRLEIEFPPGATLLPEPASLSLVLTAVGCAFATYRLRPRRETV